MKMWVFSQPDGLQLQEVGDFEAQNCLQAMNPSAEGQKTSFKH